MKLWCFIVCLTITFSFSRTLGADPILDWNNIALDSIRSDATSPPQASRMLAMMHAAMYDAVNSIDRNCNPYKVDTTAIPDTSREAAAASAAHGILTSLYPSYTATYDAALALSLSAIPDGQSKLDGIALGQYVAGEIVNWRSSDGSANTVSYTPGTEPGQWRPTPPGYAPALLPQWGDVTPFAIENGSQFRYTRPSGSLQPGVRSGLQ